MGGAVDFVVACLPVVAAADLAEAFFFKALGRAAASSRFLFPVAPGMFAARSGDI